MTEMIEKMFAGNGGSGNDRGCLTCYFQTLAVIAELP
jgi:hypothetical protein